MPAKEVLKAIGYDVSKMSDKECEAELHDIYSCE